MYISRTPRVQYNVSRSRSRLYLTYSDLARFKIPETCFFFFFFFVERSIPKIWLYIRNAIFFFYLLTSYYRSTSARTARTYTLCIMYGGALKIYKYESHGGVVSVTSCPERCSFIHTRKKFQPWSGRWKRSDLNVGVDCLRPCYA